MDESLSQRLETIAMIMGQDGWSDYHINIVKEAAMRIHMAEITQ